jgi:ATP phosphoribosyltransferase regulatory subunit
MIADERWLLPEGVDEILPPQAEQLERLCRRVIDLFGAWGYELVIPPLVEYLDSLLTGTGSDLDIQTFKLTDQLTGRLMGLRADTTPQVARIDAHRLPRDVPARYCYLGTVVHTRPGGPGDSRCPLQIGVELYGHDGIESDIEIVSLMLAALALGGLERVHVDFGHVRIFRALSRLAGLDRRAEQQLFDILQRKALPELRALLDSRNVAAPVAAMIGALVDLNGDVRVLDEARERLSPAGAEVLAALEDLRRLASSVTARAPAATLHIDLAELRGYHYHTGVMFTAYVPGLGRGVAFGGRYDDIGRAFGRARPATGFSCDLKLLLSFAPAGEQPRAAILAPWEDDPELLRVIADLRAGGEVVIHWLPGQAGEPDALRCDRQIVRDNGRWVVRKL